MLSDGIESDVHRFQFTPDLLPADLTGTEVYRPQDGSFVFQQGPLFHNLVLADEINRAPAKVQSALLDAMAERQITVGRTTHKLPQLFMAMATQNPGLVKMFFDAGPQQLLCDLQQLFSRADALGLLEIDDPLRAAEHFCSLIKGAQHFRLLVGYAEAPTDEEGNLHVRDAVSVFLRAYRR